MTDSFLTNLLPQLASGAAHTHALGFAYEAVSYTHLTLPTIYSV